MAIVLGGNCPGVIALGGDFPGGGELSRGQLSREQVSRGHWLETCPVAFIVTQLTFRQRFQIHFGKPILNGNTFKQLQILCSLLTVE